MSCEQNLQWRYEQHLLLSGFLQMPLLRILPPLFVVMLTTLVFGYDHLLPAQFSDRCCWRSPLAT
jgi:peptidoglycan/LPS O-acetylase OafA/YrhL